MDYKNAHLEWKLRESLSQNISNTPTKKLKIGLSLLAEADEYILNGKPECAPALVCEGLGWIYLSGLRDTDAYKAAIGLAQKKIAELHSVAEHGFIDWRLSPEQMFEYEGLVRLSLPGEYAAMIHKIFAKAGGGVSRMECGYAFYFIEKSVYLHRVIHNPTLN